MIRRANLMLAVLTAVAMLVAACGGDGEEPTAAPTPTPDTTAVSATFNVVLSMAPFGTVSIGIRDMIEAGTNGRIKLEHTDEPNAAVSVPQLLARNPEQYSRTMFYINEETRGLWSQGIDYNGAGIIKPDPVALYAIFPAACTTIVTNDPEVYEVADLAGKRLFPGTQGSVLTDITNMAVEAAGIKDSVTVIPSAKQGDAVLADREADAATTGIIFGGGLGSSLTPGYNRLAQTTNELWVVDIPDTLLEKMRADNPVWDAAGLLQPLRVPAGAVTPAAQVDYEMVRRDLYCPGGITVLLWTSPEVEDEIIYQMMSAMLANRDMADTSFPFIAAAWKDRVGHAFVPQEAFHPGARRAYEEAGVTYGIEGIREWQASQ